MPRDTLRLPLDIDDTIDPTLVTGRAGRSAACLTPPNPAQDRASFTRVARDLGYPWRLAF